MILTYVQRAENAVAQGTTTNSKHWDSHVRGVYPTHIKASTGPYLIDTKGKKYLDFICGLGTNLLGYGFPLVEKAVDEYRDQGKSPSLPHVLEVEVAEQLKQCFPWTERWKFLKTGSEACSAALRMARAYTGKDVVLSEGYHGWSDGFVSLTPPARGIPLQSGIQKLREDYIEGPEEVAAIIVEPVVAEVSKDHLTKLRLLRQLCDQEGILLIFDEVITGFRYKGLSVSKYHDVRPDLIVIGKAMANGYPLAAVGGPKEILDGDYFVSSTYAGEVGSLAACKAVMETVRSKPEFNIDLLWEAGQKFLSEFNHAAAPLGFCIEGYPTRGVFKGDELNIALFMQEACLAGLLFGKSWFISHAHLPILNESLDSCREILVKMTKKRPDLKGQLPKSPFAARVRNQ